MFKKPRNPERDWQFARQLPPLIPNGYYQAEKPLPFIYDEFESNFHLRHNCATIFFIGQHGRVS